MAHRSGPPAAEARPLELGEGVADDEEIFLPVRGQLDPPRHPAEEGRAEERLELADLAAHGALREVELGGGAGERQVTRRGFEAAEGVEWRQDTLPGHHA